MVVKQKGMQKRTPQTNYQMFWQRPLTKRRYNLFALYQWLQGWNIAVFNIFKTIL